jgi:ATP-dependent DNA helicase RecG
MSVKRRESVGKTSGKILLEIEKNDRITIPELASLIGVTERSIERNLQKLQSDGFLRRTGGRKEGRWEII